MESFSVKTFAFAEAFFKRFVHIPKELNALVRRHRSSIAKFEVIASALSKHVIIAELTDSPILPRIFETGLTTRFSFMGRMVDLIEDTRTAGSIKLVFNEPLFVQLKRIVEMLEAVSAVSESWSLVVAHNFFAHSEGSLTALQEWFQGRLVLPSGERVVFKVEREGAHPVFHWEGPETADLGVKKIACYVRYAGGEEAVRLDVRVSGKFGVSGNRLPQDPKGILLDKMFKFERKTLESPQGVESSDSASQLIALLVEVF